MWTNVGHHDAWCETVHVDLSEDKKNWFQDKVDYKANHDPDTVANIKLKAAREARYIRVYPFKVAGPIVSERGKLRLDIFWTEAEFRPAKRGPETKEKEQNKGKKIKMEQDNRAPGLPEPPPCVVTMCTELVRLRGGPYWSESYALLRASSRAHPDGVPGDPLLCVVDHATDGGRWVLIGSFQSDKPQIARNCKCAIRTTSCVQCMNANKNTHTTAFECMPLINDS